MTDKDVLDDDKNLNRDSGKKDAAVQMSADDIRYEQVETALLEQMQKQRGATFCAVLCAAIIFSLFWIGLVWYSLAGTDLVTIRERPDSSSLSGWAIESREYSETKPFILELLSTSRIGILLLSFPLVAAITLFGFLMHYVYGPQGRNKKSLNSPAVELMDQLNKLLSTAKSIMSKK